MTTATLSRLALTLVLLLTLGACADDPTSVTLTADGAAFDRTAPDPTSASIRMLSRNLYLGADIDRVLEDPISGGALAFAELMHTHFPSRAAVLSQEIATRRPHLIGLQEVASYNVFISPAPGMEIVVDSIPFLRILLQNLATLGVTYDVVEVAENITITLPLPFQVGGFDAYVTYRDSDVMLVDPGVRVHDSDWTHFDTQIDLPGLGPNLRSYQWAEVTVEGQRFLMVNTHLEIQRWPGVQVSQAAELLAMVAEYSGPVFMLGDFNSAANRNAPSRARTGTYGMIVGAGFDDLWLAQDGVSDNSGVTCCQASDLSNRRSELDERIDFIFARGAPYWKGARAAATRLEVFGDRPSDRFQTEAGYFLWPSDHAGLAGEIWLTQ